MKIADSLRHECMPEMVYSICKLANGERERSDIQKLITLGATDKESQDQFSNVFNFAKECNFITEENTKIICLLDSNKLNTFKEFRMQVVKGVFENRNTKFTKAAEWFLALNEEDIFSFDTGEKLSANFSASLGFNPDKYFALGFRFWMVALGFAAFQGYRKSAIAFACFDILSQWINESEFEKGKNIAARVFFDSLEKDIVIFRSMISNNKLNTALSMALRTLRDAEIINLVYTKDSSDVWHLEEAKIDAGNEDRFTELIIREA